MPAPVSCLIWTAQAVRRTRCDEDRDCRVAVWDVLSTLDDPRARRGRRHELATVPGGVAGGGPGRCHDAGRDRGWAADQRRWTLRRIGVRRDPPSLSTNGKTCRGVRGADGTRVHLFSIVDHANGVPLGQAQAPSKGFEIAAFATVLDRIDLEDVVVTADALHTQRAHARYLHHHGAKYVFIVKGNQPTLHAQLRKIPWAQIPVADRQHAKGHGRRESRTLQVAGLRPGIGFPHAKLAVRLIRTRTVGHARTSTSTRTSTRTTTETVYAVTSLGWDEVTPARLAGIIRGHWTIENRVHHVRDTTYAEDRSQVRTGTGPQVMATPRNVAIGVLRTRNGTTNIAAATRSLARRAEHLLTLLGHRDGLQVTAASTVN